MVTFAEALAAWDRAIIEQPAPLSWNDREAEVSRALTTESLGRLCEIAQDLQHAAHRALERRLKAQGFPFRLFDGPADIRVRQPWFIAPFPAENDRQHLFYCVDEAPSEWGDDWFCDRIDRTGIGPFDLAGEDLSVVMMDEGIALVTTSKRVEPFALRSRPG